MRKKCRIFRFEDICTFNLLANQVTAVFTVEKRGLIAFSHAAFCCFTSVSRTCQAGAFSWDRWTHVAMTMDTSRDESLAEVRLFLNGQRVGDGTCRFNKVILLLSRLENRPDKRKSTVVNLQGECFDIFWGGEGVDPCFYLLQCQYV